MSSTSFRLRFKPCFLAAAFFTALFGIVITDSVSERLGVPRRGETWEDVSLRRDWEVARETVLGKKKANGKKTE